LESDPVPYSNAISAARCPMMGRAAIGQRQVD
jgi:hypothetical protein